MSDNPQKATDQYIRQLVKQDHIGFAISRVFKSAVLDKIDRLSDEGQFSRAVNTGRSLRFQ